jgi:hydroxymethylpyrimidine/phosphomethylpyrimidine kinase
LLALRHHKVYDAPMSKQSNERLLNVTRGAREILFIGGLDTRAAAGLLADLRAVGDLPLLAMTVPTALTIQPKRGPTTLVATTPKAFRAALVAIFAERNIAAVKVGMLSTALQAKTLLELLPKRTALVWDPVLHASSGAQLYQGALARLAPLAARATLITPNLVEAQLIAPFECQAVLIKGGHEEGNPKTLQDVLASSSMQRQFKKQRRAYQVRGTGCALAARIAGELALGTPLPRAVERAERWLDKMYSKA